MSKRILALTLGSLFLAATLLGALTYSAHAGYELLTLVLHVNSNLADAPDATPGNGKCETANGNGICTLRAAVQESNTYDGADLIIIDAVGPSFLTRVGADNTALNGDLDVLGHVTIDGNLQTLNGGGVALAERVFHIRPGAVVVITDLAIRRGAATPLDAGGGILNEGTLTLIGVTVDGNSAYNGGGISNTGELTMVGGSIVENSARMGGGLENHGTANLRNTYIVGNTAQFGAGVYGYAGSASLTNTTVSTNRAQRDGGGIRNVAPSTLNLNNVTITENTSNDDLDVLDPGAGISVKGGTVNLRNTIISNNRQNRVNGAIYYDCDGPIYSLDYNLIWFTMGCVIGGNTSHNIIGSSALLGSLEDGGGSTLTHSLLPNSPAIDAGNPAGCADPFGAVLTTDQRGFVRPVDGNSDSDARCDMGAFEYESPGAPTATPTVPPTNTPVVTATPTNTPPPVSCISKPPAPVLASPSDNAHLVKKKVKLDWNDTVCATKYRVLVKQNSKSGPRADKKATTASKYKTKQLAKGLTYYWRVKACNVKGCTKSLWSTYKINP